MFHDVQHPKGYVTGLMELYAKLEAEKGSSKSISLGAIKDAIFQLIAAYNNVELMAPVVRETKPKGEDAPRTSPKGEESEKPKGKGKGKKETISEKPAKVETISEKRKGKSKPTPPPEPTPSKEEEEEEVITVPPFSSSSSEADE